MNPKDKVINSSREDMNEETPPQESSPLLGSRYSSSDDGPREPSSEEDFMYMSSDTSGQVKKRLHGRKKKRRKRKKKRPKWKTAKSRKLDDEDDMGYPEITISRASRRLSATKSSSTKHRRTHSSISGVSKTPQATSEENIKIILRDIKCVKRYRCCAFCCLFFFLLEVLAFIVYIIVQFGFMLPYIMILQIQVTKNPFLKRTNLLGLNLEVGVIQHSIFPVKLVDCEIHVMFKRKDETQHIFVPTAITDLMNSTLMEDSFSRDDNLFHEVRNINQLIKLQPSESEIWQKIMWDREMMISASGHVGYRILFFKFNQHVQREQRYINYNDE